MLTILNANLKVKHNQFRLVMSCYPNFFDKSVRDCMMMVRLDRISLKSKTRTTQVAATVHAHHTLLV